MNAAFQIRKAVAEDLEQVLALERAIQTLPHWRLADYISALMPVNRDPATSDLRRCLFLAEGVDGIMGFGVGSMIDTSAELESVGVDERVRRLGLGKALCGAVIDWSRVSGATLVELEVRSRSIGPISLYRSLGFVAVGLRERYYREPEDHAVLMRLGLASEAVAGGADGRDL